MPISNSALATQLQDVAAGWRSFVEQQVKWLIDEVDTITVQDPYNAGITRTIKTIWKIQQDYNALFEPASGALGQITELLADAQVLVDELNTLEDTFATYNTDFLGYRDQAQTAATQAQVHRDAAELAETHAETAETNAETAQAAAEAAAAAALDSASDANVSALAAAASASAADASADAAAASAAVFVPGVTVNGNATKATSVEFVGTAVSSVVQTGASVVVTLVGGGGGTGITDGDKGDVTVSAGGTVWTIDANTVTTGKMNIAAYSKTLLDSTTATAWRALLGLGSAATSAAGDFAPAIHSHSQATTSAAGFMSAADKTKLDGVAFGATANQTDAFLRARANHTGTQDVSTITGLAAIATSGSATNLVAGTVPTARLGSGTAASNTVLHGDNVWRIPTSAGIQVTDGDTAATTITRLVFDGVASEPIAATINLRIHYLSGGYATIRGYVPEGTLAVEAFQAQSARTVLGNPGTASSGIEPITAPAGVYNQVLVNTQASGLVWQKIGSASMNTSNTSSSGGFLKVNAGTGALSWGYPGFGDISASNPGASKVLAINSSNTAYEWISAPSSMPPNGTYGDIGVSGSTWTIVADAITGAELAANSVSTAKIAAGAVTAAKLWATGTPSSSNFLRGDGTWASLSPNIPFVNVLDYSSNIASAISAVSSTGGIVYLPPGTYNISSTLNIPSKVTLLGSGREATRILWTGSAGGTMVTVSGTTTSVRIDGVGIGYTGTTTRPATCLHIRSCTKSSFRDIDLFGFSGEGLILEPNGTNENTDNCMWNHFESLYIDARNGGLTSSAIGIVMRGLSGNTGGANCCHNTFVQISVFHRNRAVDLYDCDNNTFISLFCFHSTGETTNQDVRCNAYARANYFHHLQGEVLMAGATFCHAIVNNYDRENGQAQPVVTGAAAYIFWNEISNASFSGGDNGQHFIYGATGEWAVTYNTADSDMKFTSPLFPSGRSLSSLTTFAPTLVDGGSPDSTYD